MEKLGHLFVQPRDFGKSFLFFTETLGWKVLRSFGSKEDANRFAILGHGTSFEMILAEDHDPSDPAAKPATYQTRGKISLHFQSEDVDVTFASIRDGAHVIVRLENNHWGTRWFVVEDPDGHQFAWQGPVRG